MVSVSSGGEINCLAERCVLVMQTCMKSFKKRLQVLSDARGIKTATCFCRLLHHIRSTTANVEFYKLLPGV